MSVPARRWTSTQNRRKGLGRRSAWRLASPSCSSRDFRVGLGPRAMIISVGTIVRSSRPGSSAANEKCSTNAKLASFARRGPERDARLLPAAPPLRTRKAAIPKAWFHTGTWALFEGAAMFHRVGRNQEMIIPLRLQCLPGEIEAVPSANSIPPWCTLFQSVDGRWKAMKRSLRSVQLLKGSEVYDRKYLLAHIKPQRTSYNSAHRKSSDDPLPAGRRQAPQTTNGWRKSLRR